MFLLLNLMCGRDGEFRSVFSVLPLKWLFTQSCWWSDDYWMLHQAANLPPPPPLCVLLPWRQALRAPPPPLAPAATPTQSQTHEWLKRVGADQWRGGGGVPPVHYWSTRLALHNRRRCLYHQIRNNPRASSHCNSEWGNLSVTCVMQPV